MSLEMYVNYLQMEAFAISHTFDMSKNVATMTPWIQTCCYFLHYTYFKATIWWLYPPFSEISALAVGSFTSRALNATPSECQDQDPALCGRLTETHLWYDFSGKAVEGTALYRTAACQVRAV